MLLVSSRAFIVEKMVAKSACGLSCLGHLVLCLLPPHQDSQLSGRSKCLSCTAYPHQPPGKLLRWRPRPRLESPGKEQVALCRLGKALGHLSLAHGRLRACILALLSEPVFTGWPCHQLTSGAQRHTSLAVCGESVPCLWGGGAQCDLSV